MSVLKLPKLPRVVIALGVVSLLTDISSEMVYPLLPTILAGLGAGALSLGLVDGVGEATAAVLKWFSGRLSDRVRRRKPLVLMGYGLSALIRPALAFAAAPWQVVAIRFGDRIGKGIRSSPRDAILAENSTQANAGAVFGFHRAMDNVGATVGPGLIWVLLSLAHGSLKTVLIISAVPGLLALFVIALAVQADRPAPIQTEIPTRSTSTSRRAPTTNDTNRAVVCETSSGRAPSGLRNYLMILGFFALFNTSDLFLLRRLSELGASVGSVAISWALLNGVRALAGYPGGLFSDSFGRARSMMLGWLLYAITYSMMAFAQGPLVFTLWLCGYGLFYGFTEGAERALVASLASPKTLGSSFGVFHLVVGVALLPSNVLFGLAWERWGGPRCLVVSAVGATLAMGALLGWTRAITAQGDQTSE